MRRTAPGASRRPGRRSRLDRSIALSHSEAEQRPMAMMLALLLTAMPVRLASPPDRAPVVIPEKPNPYHSWAFLPTAFHGANKSGVFSDAAVALLAEHQMVTIEKWYTPCASQGPVQSPPSCAVESKIDHVLGRVKAINKNVSGVLYLNSMLDFQFCKDLASHDTLVTLILLCVSLVC